VEALTPLALKASTLKKLIKTKMASLSNIGVKDATFKSSK
jgi:hypothetical protein